eukprot:SAG11_NODE_2158_length_3731_cov_3.221641_3_plen_109_part_00
MYNFTCTGIPETRCTDMCDRKFQACQDFKCIYLSKFIAPMYAPVAYKLFLYVPRVLGTTPCVVLISAVALDLNALRLNTDSGWKVGHVGNGIALRGGLGRSAVDTTRA